MQLVQLLPDRVNTTIPQAVDPVSMHFVGTLIILYFKEMLPHMVSLCIRVVSVI